MKRAIRLIVCAALITTIALAGAAMPVAAAGGPVTGRVAVPGVRMPYEIAVYCGDTLSYVDFEGQFSASWYIPMSHGMVSISHHDDYTGRTCDWLDNCTHFFGGSEELHCISIGAGAGTAIAVAGVTNGFAFFGVNAHLFVLTPTVIFYDRLEEYENVWALAGEIMRQMFQF